MFKIRDILVLIPIRGQIRIRGSVPLINGSIRQAPKQIATAVVFSGEKKVTPSRNSHTSYMFAHVAVEEAKSTPQVLNDLQRARLSCGRMIRLHTHPIHPPSPVSILSLFLSLPECRRSSSLREEGGRGGRGAESYDRKKAWSSINHSVLSGLLRCFFSVPYPQRGKWRGQRRPGLSFSRRRPLHSRLESSILSIYISLCVFTLDY